MEEEIPLSDLDRGTKDYYDNMDDDKLVSTYERLFRDDRVDDSALTFTYVKDLVKKRGLLDRVSGETSRETSFISPSPPDTYTPEFNESLMRINQFVKDNYGLDNLNERTNAALELRRRIDITKGGNISFRRNMKNSSKLKKSMVVMKWNMENLSTTQLRLT